MPASRQKRDYGNTGVYILVLAFLVVTALAGLQSIDSSNCVTPPPGMVAWWKLDEEAGGDIAYDIEKDNDGTYDALNGPQSIDDGMVERAFRFDGLDDTVMVPDNAYLHFGDGDFSIDFWVRPQSPATGGQVLIEKRDLTYPYAGFWLVVGPDGDDHQLRFYMSFETG